MKHATLTIVHREQIAPAWWQIVMTAPEIAPQFQPGQFLQLRCADPFQAYLRRPIFPFAIDDHHIACLLRPDPDLGLAWFLTCQPGDSLDVLGPLGHGFPPPQAEQNLCLISDTPHVAPLLGQLYRALDVGATVAVAWGAPRQNLLFPLNRLPPSVELHIATRDGSYGERGTVQKFLPALIRWADRICVVGSAALMQAVRAITTEIRFGLQANFADALATHALFPCGVGVCMGCSLTTELGHQTVCTDGPVFDLAHWSPK